jgi:AcrR family transcriptional regulator
MRAKKDRPASKARNPDLHSTRDQLLENADKMFAARGFAGTSVRDLGAAVGIANSSLLYHFPSKKKLYAAVLERIAASISVIPKHISAQDAPGVVRQLTERFLSWSELNPDYAHIVVRELMENPARLEEIHHWYLAGFVREMRECVEKANAKGGGAGIDANMLLMIVIGAVTYFSIALPTISGIDNKADTASLRRRFLETIDRVIDAAYQPAGHPRRSSSKR